MWDWIVNFLYTVLAGLQSFSGDWGMAVILLTIIIRIILVPMTNKQTASMARMSVVQPKLKEIQERYADDPVRQNEEMRKLYAEINFNPLGGAVPYLYCTLYRCKDGSGRLSFLQHSSFYCTSNF